MPTLSVDSNNRNFGQNLINQKYSPLVNINVPAADRAFYTGLFNQRITELSRVNMFPRTLTLLTSGMPPSPIDVNSAPMVVISSNRAEWLKTLFDLAETKNRAAPFTGYSDETTFEMGLIPWYSPWRSQRALYIVVHYTEYAYYKKLLAQYPQVYVVGWQFPLQNRLGPAGFGASRFAALEFAKNVGYLRAWTVDDNVVNVNGFPNRLATIEAFMTETMAGIGFSAATVNAADEAEVKKKAKFDDKTPVDLSGQAAGLLQQVVLWNLDFLGKKKITFSPYFVTSNEDVSLRNLLVAKNYLHKVIKPLSIIKAQPYNDTKNSRFQELSGIKTRLLTLLFNLERNTQIKMGAAAARTLSSFVSETVLPDSTYAGTLATLSGGKRKALDWSTQSMAMEQVLAEAVAQDWAPSRIFNPYDGFDAAPKVVRRAA